MTDAAPHSDRLAARWRAAGPRDLDIVLGIQADVHTLMQERAEVLAEKMTLYPEGCLILEEAGKPLGYGLSHPWRVDAIPALDAEIGRLPKEPDCLFIHDVALRNEARGRGAGRDYVGLIERLARQHDLGVLALVSVYDTYPIWERCGFEVRSTPALETKLAAYGPTARYMTVSVAMKAQ